MRGEAKSFGRSSIAAIWCVTHWAARLATNSAADGRSLEMDVYSAGRVPGPLSWQPRMLARFLGVLVLPIRVIDKTDLTIMD